MKVILLCDVKGTGKKDDVLNVSDGFARNYLFPRKWAVEATPGAVKEIERKRANEERLERERREAAQKLADSLRKATGKQIEAMVYGDGAFKDPVGKIWELADPVVSPGYTAGLEGTPNELKLKYLADHDFGDLSGEALQQAVAQKIREKDASVSLVGNMVSEGTTPRHLTDLIGSLCDLTSGSGDKGTPIILVQGYFNNYAD